MRKKEEKMQNHGLTTGKKPGKREIEQGFWIVFGTIDLFD
jgi:hypothetical protein